ncbi:argininosuccinate synthase domain-containing protein [Streptomyces sp. NPDC029674]|uniref:argininosuccinate synthase domain-containing protein n=1 Tax=Streptomyces sp. NPDC029674 TaxID=3365297 RepID=UPI00384FFF08
MDLKQLKGLRVGLFTSGGLSSTAVAAWLAENGVDVTCYVADIGQQAPMPAGELATRLSEHGLKSRAVDLRAEMAGTALDLVTYQATYEGGYWNTTGASRAVLVSGLGPVLRADGCDVLAHGCVGGGNDQSRFARYAARFTPDLTVFTPWTEAWMLERFPTRTHMSTYLSDLGYPKELTDWAAYSIDGSLAGFSHESDALESLATAPASLEPLMTVWPQDAADEPGTFTVRFEGGRPVAVDGTAVAPLDAMLRANALGGRHGISLRTVVENRVNGTKCRGVYEAPGLDVLGPCLDALYQACLDKPSTALLRRLSATLGGAVYEGRFHDASGRAAAAGADLLAAGVSGTVEATLYRGNVHVQRLLDLADAPGTARQTRFTHGGHHWITQAGQGATV